LSIIYLLRFAERKKKAIVLLQPVCLLVFREIAETLSTSWVVDQKRNFSTNCKFSAKKIM